VFIHVIHYVIGAKGSRFVRYEVNYINSFFFCSCVLLLNMKGIKVIA